MKLLDQYESACEVRRLASRTVQTYRRRVEKFLRFHHDRTGRWVHPQELSKAEVEAFLTPLAVNHILPRSLEERLKAQLESAPLKDKSTWPVDELSAEMDDGI